MPTNLESTVRRAVDLNVRLYADLSRLALDYLRDLADTFRDLRLERTTAPANQPAADVAQSVQPAVRVLVLEGHAGSSAQGEFAITNHLKQTVSTRVATTSFADSGGQTHDLIFQFEPEEVDLNPGEQVLVRVKTRIGEELQPGTGYRGEFAIPDLGGATIPVVVRRRRDSV